MILRSSSLLCLWILALLCYVNFFPSVKPYLEMLDQSPLSFVDITKRNNFSLFKPPRKDVILLLPRSDGPPIFPIVCTDGRSLERWCHNQIFFAWWVTKISLKFSLKKSFVRMPSARRSSAMIIYCWSIVLVFNLFCYNARCPIRRHLCFHQTSKLVHVTNLALVWYRSGLYPFSLSS